jgi:hypothetical protein
MTKTVAVKDSVHMDIRRLALEEGVAVFDMTNKLLEQAIKSYKKVK